MVISDLNHLEIMSDNSLVEGGNSWYRSWRKNTNQTFVNFQENFSNINQTAFQSGFVNGPIYQNAYVQQMNYNETFAVA